MIPTVTNIAPITLIALDLDGTLLNSRHELSPRTERALKQAMAQGVQVILATGKTYSSAIELIERLGLTTPGVYGQGLTIVNGDGSLRYERTLDSEVARTVTAYAEAHGCHLIAVAEGSTRILAEKPSTLTDFVVAYHEPDPELVGPLSRIVDRTPINKLVIEADPAAIPGIRADLAARLDGSAALVRSMPQLLEVLPRGASKGDGLRRLLADIGVDPRHVLAFGDAENDIEMLRLAGIGVAMDNASPGAKAAANYVTASNDDDGVAEAVERFVLTG
jgi:Cof subfamily protein (haloacid dehalogenase superfamily)